MIVFIHFIKEYGFFTDEIVDRKIWYAVYEILVYNVELRSEDLYNLQKA